MRPADERSDEETPARRRAIPRITPLEEGPLLVEGPVEIVLPDGTVRDSDRPVVALCRCRRSRRAPFCDTSHRRRARRTSEDDGADHATDEDTHQEATS